MMARVGEGAPDREGVRMGLWGAAQAVAFGLGGVLATLAVDGVRRVLGVRVKVETAGICLLHGLGTILLASQQSMSSLRMCRVLMFVEWLRLRLSSPSFIKRYAGRCKLLAA